MRTGLDGRDGNAIMPALRQDASTAAVPFDPHALTLAQSAHAYIISKRRRLTPASERGYVSCLRELIAYFPQHRIVDFEPPAGATLIEDFLSERWGHLSPRTYNKAFSIVHNFFEWFVARGVLNRDPMAALERAKARAVHRTTFSADQREQILAANPEPRDQTALRLLLDYAIRKGALRGVRFEHFDHDSRRLVIFTKGEKIHTLPIVDKTIWEHIAALDEPGHHYLLPKQLTRKRIPPHRRELTLIGGLLRDARKALTVAAGDETCARELAELLTAIGDGERWLSLATAAASTRVRLELTEPIGEHGAHLWWYRCLSRAGIVDLGTTSGQRMHKARHTAIQSVLDSSGNLKAAQALAGHATIGTTGDIYAGWDDVRLEDTMRELDGSRT